MGKTRAANILLFNQKLTAKQALDYGLITEIIENENFMDKCIERLERISKLSQDVNIFFKK